MAIHFLLSCSRSALNSASTTSGKKRFPNISQKCPKSPFWDMPWELHGKFLGWLWELWDLFGNIALARVPKKKEFWDAFGMPFEIFLRHGMWQIETF
jgi:hypothetical protein